LFARILDRAGGNPLFLEEIIRGLIEGGALERDGAQWRMKSDEAAADIPASIQALLLARLDRLPHQVRQVAQEAAVIGPRFDAAVLGGAGTEPAKVGAGV
jgi:predicted ATPase